MRTKMIKMDFEAERLKTAFQVLDLDQDGFITREELAHALSKTGDQFTDDEISDIIERADKNKDGKIDYNGNVSRLSQTIHFPYKENIFKSTFWCNMVFTHKQD
jgi:Ca2+-binding EF-hand superfamily protein